MEPEVKTNTPTIAAAPPPPPPPLSAPAKVVVKKRALTAAEVAEKKIREQPIALAYALIPVPGHPGHFHDVILHGVTGYDRIEFLDKDARPSKPVYAIGRVHKDIENKRFRKQLL